MEFKHMKRMRKEKIIRNRDPQHYPLNWRKELVEEFYVH
jgi:hypothetical protein